MTQPTLPKTAYGSWLAYSVSTVLFVKMKDDTIRLLLGIRGQAPTAIPEPGQFCLFGGFNTDVPGPAMFKQVANQHLRDMLDINPNRMQTLGQISQFVHCEFPMDEIEAPLKTPLGDIHIKRVAFMRALMIDEATLADVTPMGKLCGVKLFTFKAFIELVETGNCSFPYQVTQVTNYFNEVRAVYEGI